MPSEPKVAHIQVFFSGRVQGVGFRYQTLQIAKSFEASGWVQNLDDGQVLLEAEGNEDEIMAFKTEIENQLAHFIKESTFTLEQRAPQFTGFTIRR